MNYSTTDKELLAVDKSIEHYKHYLLGKRFTLKTDHQALQHLQTASNDNSRILRIALKLPNYQFTPIYIKGETNIADVLSRPVETLSINRITEITDEQKQKILKRYHLISDPGSTSNMKFLIKKRYYWPSIFKDIEKCVSECTLCLKSGEALVNSKNRVITTTYPNELWEIDLLIGRIPGKNQSNQFIFVAIDHYTKWIEAKVIQNKTAEEIVQAAQELIIQKHGIPKRILTDCGLEFNNEKTKELSRRLNFTWEFSSPRHHETVGAVERVNQTLMNILKKLTNFGTEPWENKLQQAVYAYNISFHRAINTSPYILKLGKVPLIDVDQQLEQQEIIVPKTEATAARDSHLSSYNKAIQKGKRVVKYNLKIGDKVLVYIPPLSEKFKEKWYSGYTIKDYIHPDAYLITKRNKDYRLNKTHVKLDTSALAV